MINTAKQYDVVIVGGAMVGASLALSLQKLAPKLTLAVIEAQTLGAAHPGFDSRAIAVNHASVDWLQRMQIWSYLDANATLIKDINVSDRGHFGMADMAAKRWQLNYFGQVIGLADAGYQLYRGLASHPKISLYCPAKVVACTVTQDSHDLTLDDGNTISAKLVVAADGLHSQIRQQLTLPLEQVSFGQSGLIATLTMDRPHHNKAYERFTEYGPLALLPMGDKKMSMVWAMTSEQLQQVEAMDDKQLLTAIQKAFGFRAGIIEQIQSKASYPLMLSSMTRTIYHRTVFVGNAAQTLHPIAGQGFNLGLRDIKALSHIIAEAFNAGADVGANHVLHEYWQQRQQDRNNTISAIETLVRGFSNDYLPLVAGRNCTLRLLAWLPQLQTPLVSKATGY
ncbi:2-octaprenyl-6-methoxyphenyl hydroxylase [Paraferrimonas sp. SM1919]|uniref:2-octaprenyl-6-methoxyphenyl hydroxylase n=1 Tax=Paraferrimonas sp. SM1919 TaxID=2662263 RepID=UPI0013D63581|nr:2-octaprenyl-6-methoxyphenyl hydroxylase [Paraferrimonas sp. SM1919]